MSFICIIGHNERKKIATVTLVKFLVVCGFSKREREREKSN